MNMRLHDAKGNVTYKGNKWKIVKNVKWQTLSFILLMEHYERNYFKESDKQKASNRVL
jgi:hypothetical protein